MKDKINQGFYTGERPLFGKNNLFIENTIFTDGESPLKECNDIDVDKSSFQWKYPLWYSDNVNVKDSTWAEMARAGVWYSNNLNIENSLIEAPKNFRRCNDIVMTNVFMPNAKETLWHCNNVTLKNVSAKGDYFAMNCTNMDIDGFNLAGNYSFDGARNVTVRNAKMLSKDAFWNTENVTVYDSYISGEYLGWNAKNLTLVNCTIESLQGMCYIDNLVMKNCRLLNTALAFEYSTVDVQINGSVESIINPASGIIKADAINKIILQEEYVDVTKTKIIIKDGTEGK